MTLSADEIESVRFHLGYGNVAVGALPYTQDGYWSIFNQIVSPYLGTGTETSSVTPITARTVTVVTPAAMTGITVAIRLVIDSDDQLEIVTVKAVTSTTFTAYFAKAHTAAGYQIATMSGKAKLRMLLRDADAAWLNITGASTGATGGLKQADNGGVTWFEGLGANPALRGKLQHYRAICGSISSLVRVPTRESTRGGGASSASLEAF